MRMIASLIIFGILLSYAPMVSLEDCPDTGHSARMILDCGSLFHCPFILNASFLGNFLLPLKGKVVLINHPLPQKLISRPIFHPPEFE